MNNFRWCIVLSPEGAARTVSLNIADALTRLLPSGNCKVIDPASYLSGYKKLLVSPDPTMIVDLFNQSCAVSCLDFLPTHCLVGALAPVTLFTLNLLRKYSVCTSHWFYEDYHKATYWRSVLTGYDHFFAVQHGTIEQECRAASSSFHFLPTATACGNYEFSEQVRDIGVLFIGIPSRYRIEVLETLCQQHIPLAIAGAQWDSYKGILDSCIITRHWIDEPRSFGLMQRAKMGLNLSFDNPSGRSDVQISPRFFDYAAAACSIVSDATPLLGESASFVSCRTFTDKDHLPQMIRQILDTYQSTVTECSSNRNAVLARHTYLQRAQSIIEMVAQ